jgi:transcription termination factor Rho
MPQKRKGSGLLKRHKGKMMLLDAERPFDSHVEDIIVPDQLIREHRLVEGVAVEGSIRKGKKGIVLAGVDTVCGLQPKEFAKRQPYQRLTAVAPFERFKLSVTGEPSMRVMDLIAPIAKGTRGLIVSPPRAGKTVLLEQIAKSVQASDPETRIIVLLIDERPEEVTHFRRQVNAEVLASSNDRNLKEHVALTELVMAHVTAELECGRDVVVLVDSLTRMARAFNLGGPNKSKGRIMSGGLQAGAMEIPRRFFGMARCIEGGGSVTIIATVLVDTGSRMDQLIFEEFKGTGNSELMLDRNLAEARIFPAVNLPASGTRKEELLFNEKEYRQVTRLRKALAKIEKPKEGMELLLKFLNKYPTNDDFLNEEA